MAPLRMYFQRSKRTLDSLKRVFNVFRRKQSLGALDVLSWHYEGMNLENEILKTYVVSLELVLNHVYGEVKQQE